MTTLKHAFLLFLPIITFFFTGCDDGQKNPSPPAADTPVIINNKQILPPSNQNNAYAEVDVSPMDMTYYPPNYPQLKLAKPTLEPPVLRVIYSRPHLQGRVLFRDILKYDEPWRLGANEATEIQVYQNVTIDGKKLSKGRYTIRCIPHRNEWTIVFNSAIDVWGIKFDPSKDILKVKVPVTHRNPSIEYFTMVFEKADAGANLLMAWDDVVVKLAFAF